MQILHIACMEICLLCRGGGKTAPETEKENHGQRLSARDLDCNNQTWCAISRLTIALAVELAIWFVITVPEIYASGRAGYARWRVSRLSGNPFSRNTRILT